MWSSRVIDPPVCPECGEPAGEDRTCRQCGEDLRRHEKLPLRTEWLRSYDDRTSAVEEHADIADTPGNPVGAAVALLGAILGLVGSFTSVHQYGIVPIQKNSYIAEGYWWILLASVILGIGAAYLLIGQARTGSWKLVIPSLAVIGGGVIGLSHHFQQLEITATGQTFQGTPGIGVYLTLVGGIMGVVGAAIYNSAWHPWPAPSWERRPTKQCPDCAETILLDANVCKHCGYRFGARESPEYLSRCKACGAENMVRSPRDLCHACRKPVGSPMRIDAG